MKLPASVPVNEFFPLLTRLAQELKSPIFVLDCETTGISQTENIGLVEYAALSISMSGAVSMFSTLVCPEIQIQPGASKVHGISASDVADAPRFPSIYDPVTKAFTTGLVVGFNSRTYDVPVLCANMARYQLPIMNARGQLDVRDMWAQLQGPKGKLAELAAHYNVEPGKAHRAAGDVITTARILETMLWKHGSDLATQNIVWTSEAYSVPGQVEAPAHATAITVPRSVAEKGKYTDAEVARVIAEAVAAGNLHHDRFGELAELTGKSLDGISIVVGRMLGRGQIPPECLVVEEQQEILSQALPAAIKAHGTEKLKPLREHIQANAKADVDYIQIRIALLRHGAAN